MAKTVLASAVALPLIAVFPVSGPTPAQAGVISSVKGAAKKVGGAVKNTAKGIGAAAKAGAAVGKQVGVGVARDVKGAAVRASKTGIAKSTVDIGKGVVRVVKGQR